MRDTTQTMLSELAAYLESENIPFIILLIPDKETVSGTIEQFSHLQSLVAELAIPYINPIDLP